MTFATVDGSSAPILTDQQLRLNATALGLDLTAFDACFPPGDGKAARVQQDVNSGTALGVSSTPIFFLGDTKVSGFKTAAEMTTLINQKLGG